MYKVLFPEDNPFITEAAEQLRASGLCEVLLEKQNLTTACEKVVKRECDAIVAGIDNSSRDVILSARDVLGAAGEALSDGKKLFSSLFVADLPDGRQVIVSDGATCKNPNSEQLARIAELTFDAASKILNEEPRMAFLSFSTNGSGGKDPSMDKIREALAILKSKRPDILADGEMQLDAAINPRIGAKKMPESRVAGRANILIVPDINSGNILYKSLEQFAGAHVAGPILLGFNYPISDLSRGSTAEDIVITTKYLLKLI